MEGESVPSRRRAPLTDLHLPTRSSSECSQGARQQPSLATTAAAAGANERQIANQTGHTSMEVLRRYIRHGSLFTDNAATRLGL